MIPAYKSEAFTNWFSRDAERRIAGAFDGVRVRGLDTLRAALSLGPVLVVTNHTAWWDPLVALYLTTRVLRCDAYAMMDAKNLERLPFFGKVGAFGVDLADPADGARAIRYAAKLLRGPEKLVWVFAQGREVPVTVRPLGFRPGSAEIARVARAPTVPGALRYEMGATPRPVLWASFGSPLPPVDVEALRGAQEAAVGKELEGIEQALARGDDAGFAWQMRPREDSGFSLAQTALAWMTRPRNR